ncbi:MAG TPA: spermidine synthase, partial [Polyangia bacterium]
MAFFLLETSNIVSLSVLYGSTWTVNLVVFSGILSLVLLGNLTCARFPTLPLGSVVAFLLANLGAAYLVPATALLNVGNLPLRTVATVLLFLGPVFFSAILFARLIAREQSFYAAYGSNVLGAMVGGAVEYLSLVFGFKALLIPTAVCYLLAFALVRRKA